MNCKQDKETILSVVFDPDLGLCIELGDEKVDKEVYGYGPTQDFVRAVTEEIEFQIGNTVAPDHRPTLGRVFARLQLGLEKCRG